MKNRSYVKRKKYVAGSLAAIAMIIASCGLGTMQANTVSTNDYDRVYLAENEETTESVDATEEENETDELIKQISTGKVEQKDVYKDETVYAFADASGKTNSVLVSEHLSNKDGKTELKDKTDLKDIVNVKGDEEFEVNGDTITWKANGNDIYYQGTTDKEVPVSVAVKYYLDGKEMKPCDMAGKSGKVTIHVDYSNTAVLEEKVDGKTKEVKVPFVAVTGMVLNDGFKNVQIDHGKTLEEGDSHIVIGYGVPGLRESLDIKDGDLASGVDIPESFEVTADVENFSLDMTVTVVMNASEMNMAGNLDSSNLDTVVASLDSSTTQLADGTSKLADGVSLLYSKMGEFNTGMNNLKTGLDTFNSKTGDLVNGVAVINATTQSVKDGINQLDTALNTPLTDEEKKAYQQAAASQVETQFAEGTDAYNKIYQGAKTAISGDDTKAQVAAALNANPELHAALLPSAIKMYADAANLDYATIEAAYNSGEPDVKAAVDGIVYSLISTISSNTLDGISDNAAIGTVNACKQAAKESACAATVSAIDQTKKNIAGQIEAVQPNGYSLVTGTNALAVGTSQLEESIPMLTSGISQIVSGANQLNSGSAQLKAGIFDLNEGATTLDSGMKQYKEQAIKKLVNAYNGSAKKLINNLDGALKASADYDTFSQLNEGDAGATKFIIKTEGISAN